MSGTKWFVRSAVSLATVCVLMLPASQASAQAGLVNDLFGWLFNIPRWAVDVHGGYGNYGRFLLQGPTDDDVFDLFQRELRGRHAWTAGAGLTGMILPRTGLRLGANYTWADLDWRDDTGTGSHFLDIDDVGDLTQFILSAEVVRYLLLESSRVSPYASAGVLLSWYGIDDSNQLLAHPGGDSQFRWGATGSVGLQIRLAQKIRLRLDATTASIGNPFTGRESFISQFGRTIDEPTRVRKTDFRLALAYAFGQPGAPITTDGGKGNR